MVVQGVVCVHSGVASLSFRSGPEQRSTGLGGIRGKGPQPLRILNALGREGQRMAARNVLSALAAVNPATVSRRLESR